MTTATATARDVQSAAEPLESAYDVARRVLGRRPSPQLIYRWRRQGLQGIRMPALTFGGVARITEGEFRRWIDAVSAAAEADD